MTTGAAAMEAFTTRVADAVLERDFPMLHGMLAPWLQSERSPPSLRTLFDAQIHMMMEEWTLEESGWPISYRVGLNPLDFAALRVASDQQAQYGMHPRVFPPEVNPDSFRKWARLAFETDPQKLEFDEWFSMWIVVVEERGEHRVGYFEFE